MILTEDEAKSVLLGIRLGLTSFEKDEGIIDRDQVFHPKIIN